MSNNKTESRFVRNINAKYGQIKFKDAIEEHSKKIFLSKSFLSKRSKLSGSKKKLRVGRGIGSGKGKTCGRGYNGQKSKEQAPVLRMAIKNLIRKIPKRGMSGKVSNLLTITTEQLFNVVCKLDKNFNEINNEIILKTLKSPKKYSEIKVIMKSGFDMTQFPKFDLNVSKLSESVKSHFVK